MHLLLVAHETVADLAQGLLHGLFVKVLEDVLDALLELGSQEFYRLGRGFEFLFLLAQFGLK